MPMTAAVPGEKRHLLARQLADHIVIRWRAPRRLERDFFVRGKTGHGIEPAAADDADCWFLHS